MDGLDKNLLKDSLNLVLKQVGEELNAAFFSLSALRALNDKELREKYIRSIWPGLHDKQIVSTKVEEHVLPWIDETLSSIDDKSLRSSANLAQSEKHYEKWAAKNLGIIDKKYH